MKKSEHYKKDRFLRERLIKKIGKGEIVDIFYWNRGHPDGPENHVITSTGLIYIYNIITNKLVTILIARPAQIRRYYEKEGRCAPDYLIQTAFEHQQKGYNKL